jgi:nucleoside-diphosphate-sugar epimerase
MARVLVAGGGGFIGRRLVARLADARAAGRADMAAAAADGADALVWAAGGRVADAAAGLEVHARGPVRALEASGARTCVYLSSGEVYGAQDVPFRESARLVGSSPYAQAKIAGERAIAEACAARGARLFVLRPAVVYGPGQGGSMLLPSLMAALAARRRFAMTRGEQTRDFLYVDDLTALIARCLEPDAPAGTYNAGTGRETEVVAMARAVADEVGRRGDFDAQPLLDAGALPYRDGEQMRYVLDVSATRDRLGWTATTALDAGIAATVASALAT